MRVISTPVRAVVVPESLRQVSRKFGASLFVVIVVRLFVVGQVLGPDGRPVEAKQATSFEDAVDDRVGQVVVVEHGAPGAGSLFVVQIIERRLTFRSLTTL